MDGKSVFSKKAKIYQNARPGYPDVLKSFLELKFQLDDTKVIADIGAGTGKFTELLLDLNCTIYAVEPNHAMVNILRDALECENLFIVERPAEDTEIESSSIDCITSAQSFHWFDHEAFKKEAKRILKPGGDVILLWNMRENDAPVNIKTREVFETYCPEFYGFSGGKSSEINAVSTFFNHQYEHHEIAYPIQYCRDGFIQRCLSASYALTQDDQNYEAFVDALKRVYDLYEIDGQLTVPNITEVYYGKVHD